MTPFAKRNLLILVSAILFIGLLYCLISLVPTLKGQIQHLELIVISLLIMMSLVVMLFWISLGVFGGLTCFLLAMMFIYKPLTDLNPYYYSVLILAFFLNSFLGDHIHRKINKINQDHTVTMEKVHEDTNLIQNHFKNRIAEISAMEGKIDSLLKLKNISDDLSLTFPAEEVIRVVLEKTFDKFRESTRVLFYLVGENREGLFLSNVLKANNRKTPVMEKGGIFERWVIKNMQTLLVKDAGKDFRFSIGGEEKKDDFVSLISKPLISEGNILGILRVDSSREGAFGQHELRVLDIIGELGAISLENAKLYRRTEELAIKDSLTGLYVYRYFMEHLEEEVKRGTRSGIPFALFMIDIDDFKKFNDKYGHIAGDLVLKNVSRTIESKASAGDIICRYGGEEFAFLALNCDKKRAVKLAGDIKDEIQDSYVSIRRKKRFVTVSIGIAMFPKDAKLREDLIGKADRCLYEAKAKGKNRVCSK